MTQSLGTLVAVATYNEIENLPRLVEEIFRYAPDAEILIVDDNSPDGTGQWCETHAGTNPRLHVIHRPTQAGLGHGHAAGDATMPSEQGYELLLTMDADFSHSPEDIPRLLRPDTRSAGRRRRSGDRLALCAGRPHCRLAVATALDEPPGQPLRAALVELDAPRLQRRLSLLPRRRFAAR